jgi:transcriptional regulator with XRE-family HTH domain
MICPPDHAHGQTSTCRSLHHCKCDDCREFAKQYEFWRQAQIKRGKPLLIPSIGTQRRIRALHRMGYSQRAVARLAGRTEPWVTHLMRVDKVKPATAELIAGIYDTCWMTPATGITPTDIAAIAKCRRYAEKAGWPGPLEWDDIDHDAEPIPLDEAEKQGKGSRVLEDAEWLLNHGESPEHVAKTLGRTAGSLAKLARFHNRPDIATRFYGLDKQERPAA